MMEDRFKGNAHRLEMSRYIDLEVYHRVERTHPFYEEMIEALHDLVRPIAAEGPRRLWEFGAGTGLATGEFLKHPNLRIDALDLDSECCRILSDHLKDAVACICDDALTHGETGAYDLAASVFAHDHIPYELGPRLAANIRRNLKRGGRYVMGGEILPYFHDDDSRREALYRYHGFIVSKAMRDENFEVAQIEINALKSGLYKIGDFKRHEAMFEAEMLSGGQFRIAEKLKIGPSDLDDVGGVYVYAFEAV